MCPPPSSTMLHALKRRQTSLLKEIEVEHIFHTSGFFVKKDLKDNPYDIETDIMIKRIKLIIQIIYQEPSSIDTMKTENIQRITCIGLPIRKKSAYYLFMDYN